MDLLLGTVAVLFAVGMVLICAFAIRAMEREGVRMVETMAAAHNELLTALLTLKVERGAVLDPAADDERWGVYVQTPDMEIAEVERREEEERRRAAMEADEELLAQLGDL